MKTLFLVLAFFTVLTSMSVAKEDIDFKNGKLLEVSGTIVVIIRSNKVAKLNPELFYYEGPGDGYEKVLHSREVTPQKNTIILQSTYNKRQMYLVISTETNDKIKYTVEIIPALNLKDIDLEGEITFNKETFNYGKNSRIVYKIAGKSQSTVSGEVTCLKGEGKLRYTYWFRRTGKTRYIAIGESDTFEFQRDTDDESHLEMFSMGCTAYQLKLQKGSF